MTDRRWTFAFGRGLWPPLALLLAVGGPAGAADLSPQAAALIAPVHEAFAAARKELADLPPPPDDSERVLRIGRMDMAGRRVLVRTRFETLPESERLAAQSVADAEIAAADLEDQAQLKRLIPPEGWFSISRYGQAAATAAFDIVQHALDDADLQISVLDHMAPMVATGEADPQLYAMLYDRVAQVHRHRPQRYGTQVQCIGGVWMPINLEDPAKLDERRKTMRFEETEAQYLAHFKDWTCLQTHP